MVQLTISVGQCGNQIASEMWGRIVSEWEASSSNPRSLDALSDFLRFDSRGMPHARAVLVDSEPKAVRWAIEAPSPCAPLFDVQRQVACSNSGRGNNWAFGYHNRGRMNARQLQEEAEQKMKQMSLGARGRTGAAGAAAASGKPQWWSPQLIAADKMNSETEGSMTERAVEAIRREAERCDAVTDILMMHSISGGTGSGLGSRLLQTMRDESNLFPKNYIMAASIFPFQEGDTPLQSYNAALTLRWLSKYADGICAFSNDDLLASLGGSGARAGGGGGGGGGGASRGPKSSLSDINRQVVTSLMGLVWPSLAPFSGTREGLTRLQDTVVQVCPDDRLKFFEAWSAVSTSSSELFADTWQGLLRAAGSRAPQTVRLVPDRYVGTAYALQPASLPPGKSNPAQQMRSERAATSCSLITLFGGTKEFEDFRAGGAGGGAGGTPGRPAPRARVDPRGPRGGAASASDGPGAPERGIDEDWALFSAGVEDSYRKSGGLNHLPRCQNEVSVRWSPAFSSVLSPPSPSSSGLGGPPRSRAAAAAAAAQGKGVVVACNRSRIIERIEGVARRAQEMLEARAFLHWYEQHGCSRSDIERAVEALWDVSDSYRAFHGFPSTN